MKPFILFIAVILAGCTKVTPADQAHAVKLCADNGGVIATDTKTYARSLRGVTADCADGTQFRRIGK